MSGLFSITGLASGLDTKAIIDAIMAQERLGVDRLQAKVDLTKKKQQALTDIKGRVATLQQRIFDLTLSSKVNARSATSTDTSVLTATASSTAAKGTFNVEVKQLATATTATSTTPIGGEINAAVALDQAGFATDPTDGTFTINGFTVTIADVTSDTLQNVVDAINDPGVAYGGVTAQVGIGVTAAIVNDDAARPNVLQLTAAAGEEIQLGAVGDTSNFLTVAKLLGVDATSTQTGGTLSQGDSTAGNDATISSIDVSDTRRSDTYTFSYNAGTNVLTLTRTGDGATDTVTLVGLAAGVSSTLDFDALDVSITVTALNADGEPADDIGSFLDTKTIITTATSQSQGNLGSLLTTEALADANFDTALNAASGSFTINGKTIAWQDTEALTTIISRINSAGAGVVAAYDSVQDALTLSSTTTGSQLITMADVAGNFLAATKLTAAGAQTAGANAVFTIDTVDGGANLFNSSNTVSSIVPGVTLSLKKLGTTQVTVAQDTSTTVTAVKAFVDQYNSAMDLIRQKTKYDSETKKAEILLGDSSVRLVQSRLRTLVTDEFYGATADDEYKSLMDVGVTSGAIGSAVGTTDDLVVDTAKLTAALEDDPDAVELMFKGFTNSIDWPAGDGAGSIVDVAGSPSREHRSGDYEITSVDLLNGTVSLSGTFTPSGSGVSEDLTTVIVTAGESTSTMIPGMTLTVDAVITAGTDTITVTLDTLGVAHRVNDYLSDLIGVEGLFASRREASDDQIESLNDQIDAFEERLVLRRAALENKFKGLETALTGLQQQSLALQAQLARIMASGNTNQ
ncbi:MAG: flagellar filament capping protein FliD [Chloroflexi bacterium]|nr:flagellar filament capping protein FliD [Chloroflexota bacterium]